GGEGGEGEDDERDPHPPQGAPPPPHTPRPLFIALSYYSHGPGSSQSAALQPVRHRDRRRPVHRLAHNEPVNDRDPPLTPERRALLEEVRDTAPADELAVATRLRREHPAELVSAALAQARLRQRAAAKFGAEDARRMFFTANGVEQSTRASVAAHRARRFAELGVTSVADLCCGIGGGAIALARGGVRGLARGPRG